MTKNLCLARTGSFAAMAASAFLISSLAYSADYQTDRAPVSASVVADGLQNPWGMDFLPDGSVLVTERAGTMRIVKDGGMSAPIAGVPDVWANGQGGLLDVALSPGFEQSGLIFFSHSQPGSGGAGTAVSRARLVTEGESSRLEGVETIFSMSKKTGKGQHFGSRLVFHPDGTLFVTTGDRGDGPRAQDMRDHAGAVHRINVDGSIPADNPSPDGAAHLPEIWSKGHRNPQGAVFDPVTKALWTVEHGAQGGDELNRPEAGKNYGWPRISYGRNYSGSKIGVGAEAPGFEQPEYYWDPSIAPSGLAVYQGDMFPEWQGDFLVGALKFQLLARLDRDDQGKVTGEERMFEGAFGRIRDVNVAPDGSIYLLTDDTGRIVRLTRGD